MYIDEEKLGIYQAVKKRSEARGVEKMVLKLLAKLPPEQVAELSDMSLAEIQAIATANESS